MLKVRRDVWTLQPWDPILVWYAKAIGEMQRRPINDPTSWRYQAAIHDYVRGDDPNAKPDDQLPTDQKRFWRQCQHNSWFFLPWHRMYLACFEQIVAATVTKLGGPNDWALPYWNYSDSKNPNARKLPPAFIAQATPTGEPNPLRVEDRSTACNQGKIITDTAHVDVSRCLSEPAFVAQPQGGNPGFGGPQTKFNHDSGSVVGKVELVPHGAMHVAVGGWMGFFNTAALDPVFWLHHANIDRLWEVWRLRDPNDVNPGTKLWLTATKFEFHDSTGAIVALTPSQVLDTTAEPLAYNYDNTADPLATIEEGAPAARRWIMAEEALPEMVGATERPVVLKAGATTAHLSVSPPTGPALEGVAGAAERPAYLNLENITASGAPNSYAVYLNLPAGADPQQHEDLFAGILPMFGAREAARSDEEHAGSGLHYALEVSEIIERLKTRNAWDPNDLRVTFVPQHAAGEAAEIQVGRVSLYYT